MKKLSPEKYYPSDATYKEILEDSLGSENPLFTALWFAFQLGWLQGRKYQKKRDKKAKKR